MSIYEPHLCTKMPPPASRTGGPYVRLLLLRHRVTPDEHTEVESMLRCLETHPQASLSPVQLGRLKEIEESHR